MRESSASSRADVPRGAGGKWARELASAGLIGLAIWLGWQVVRELVIIQGPPALAVQIAPGSALALRRAAEAEYAAAEYEDASDLARLALKKAPFGTRTLRIVGLVQAEQGRLADADATLTMAGNRSLRDNAAHAWLVNNRLRQGDYYSAFAHADALARRRLEFHDTVFDLFTVAVATDPRATGALIERLVTRPPWRGRYLTHVLRTDQGRQVAADLALNLQATDAPFTDEELGDLYVALVTRGQTAAAVAIRERVRRPAPDRLLVNGDFGPATAPRPFAWTPYAEAGLVADILADDPDGMLRVEHDGFVGGVAVEQMLSLKPGPYVLTGRIRVETGDASRLNWQVMCVDQTVLGSVGAPTAEATPDWRLFRVEFTVPPGCGVQWLRLRPTAALQKNVTVAWYDDFALRIRPGLGLR